MLQNPNCIKYKHFFISLLKYIKVIQMLLAEYFLYKCTFFKTFKWITDFLKKACAVKKKAYKLMTFNFTFLKI